MTSAPAVGRDPEEEEQLRAQGLRIRPLVAGERQPVLEVFSAMSGSSRAHRFLTGMVRLPESMVRALVDLEAGRHEAWVATVDGVAAGVARFVRLDQETAEFAVAVKDDAQGRGVGRALLRTAAWGARASGIRRFRGTLATENHPMFQLLTGVDVRIQQVGHVVEVDGLIPPGGRPTDDGTARSRGPIAAVPNVGR